MPVGSHTSSLDPESGNRRQTANQPPYLSVNLPPNDWIVFQIRRDEQFDMENERELARLRYENKYLRDCLKIGKNFGSIPADENTW